jgi:hypothetical protein
MIPRAWSFAGVLVGAAALVVAPEAAAQSDGPGFAVGPRLTFIRGANDSTEPSQRFSGAVMRLGGGKTAIELAIDYRSDITGDLSERIKDYPIQGSLLFFPVRSTVSPYLLGGLGWYTQSVQRLEPGGLGPVLDEETTRRVGYHGGLGAELRLHRHFGLYGDYRYTFIRFGGDEPEPPEAPTTSTPRLIPFAERLRMSHEGSMWTWGATFFF